MVAFLTLFLNLVSGIQQVEVAVDGSVAVVEIRLDGHQIGVMSEAPWHIDCDFGDDLRPHRLEAIARDRDNREVARASQHINVPRAPAEAQIVLERDDVGLPRTARVAWESAIGSKARSITVRLDQIQLVADTSGRFVLPAYDPQLTHILSAEVLFRSNLSASAQVTFGGLYGSEVRTELTAVPVMIPEGGPAPNQGSLKGLFHADGVDLRVVAVEDLGARLLMVQADGALARLSRLARMLDSRRLRGFPRNLVIVPGAEDLTADVLQMVVPRPDVVVNRGRSVITFPFVGPLRLDLQPLPWVVTHARAQDPPDSPQQLADAVAAAGIGAAASSCPRAVVLVFGDAPERAGLYSPEAVRAYLRRIHVPLFVWSVTGESEPGGWGQAVDASSTKRLSAASRDLLASVGRQWIVWLEGRPLPDHIRLRQGAEGLRLAQ